MSCRRSPRRRLPSRPRNRSSRAHRRTQPQSSRFRSKRHSLITHNSRNQRELQYCLARTTLTKSNALSKMLTKWVGVHVETRAKVVTSRSANPKMISNSRRDPLYTNFNTCPACKRLHKRIATRKRPICEQAQTRLPLETISFRRSVLTRCSYQPLRHQKQNSCHEIAFRPPPPPLATQARKRKARSTSSCKRLWRHKLTREPPKNERTQSMLWWTFPRDKRLKNNKNMTKWKS